MTQELTLPYMGMDESMEAFDNSPLEISPELTVAFEHFNGLFKGLKQISIKDLKNPLYRSSIESRFRGISEHCDVSFESLMDDYDNLGTGTYSTESGVLTAIADWVVKVLQWLTDAVTKFLQGIGNFFKGSKARAAATTASNVVVNGALRRDSKGKPVLPDILGVPLPGIILVLFHSQKYTPLVTHEFSGETLLKQVGLIQNQMKYLATKLESDLDAYIEAVTSLVDFGDIGNSARLDDVGRKLTRARAMKGLYANGFKCAGFEIVERPTNSKNGYNQYSYNLKSMDSLISTWRASEGFKFTIVLKDFERLNKEINKRTTETDTVIERIADKVKGCRAFDELKARARDRRAIAEITTDSTLQNQLNEVLVNRIDLLQNLVTEIIRNTSMIQFYQERYGKLLTQLFTEIAKAVDTLSKQ